LRMAVAIYVTGISTPEVHPEFPPLLGTLTEGAADEQTNNDSHDAVSHELSPFLFILTGQTQQP